MPEPHDPHISQRSDTGEADPSAGDNDVAHGTGQRRPSAGPAQTSEQRTEDGGTAERTEPGLASPADNSAAPPLTLDLAAHELHEAALQAGTDPMDAASFVTGKPPSFDEPVLYLHRAKELRAAAVEDTLAAVLTDFAAQLEEDGGQ
jgi:hypothetical protein